jgi:predicted dehydrogenase
MNQKLRFGMIGAGSIANAHVPALLATGEAEIICIADSNEDQAKVRAEQWGAPRTCARYDDLIAMDDLDAVVVGIPTGFHAEATIKALNSGKHVLCEKPMARTLEECDAMLAAAERAGKVLQIGFVRRFDDHWGMMRRLVQEGKAGRPCMWRRIHAGAAPAGFGEWYSDSRCSDGPLVESGSHDLDFLVYTFGKVKSVLAHMDHLSHHGDVLDNPIVILYFESGDQALIQWSWSLPRGAKPGFLGMDVIGPEGCIYEPLEEDGQWIAKVSKPGGEIEEIPFENRRDRDTWSQGQMWNFIRSIRGEETPRATGHDGRHGQEIYLAAVKSMAEGRRIDLPL